MRVNLFIIQIIIILVMPYSIIAQQREFLVYTTENGIPFNNIGAIGVDNLNNIWFSNGPANAGGLVKFDGDTAIIFTTDDGLPFNNISAIAADGLNNIWFGNGPLNASGLGFYGDSSTIVSIIAHDNIVPVANYLSQNYPNPFNPETVIEYTLSNRSKVSLNIYNLRGQEIARLVNEQQEAGSHKVTWDASNVSSGIYFYRLQAGDFVQTRKMVLLK